MNNSADEPLSDLKSLISRGRSQGYVTYAELGDFLPFERSTPEQIKDVTQILDDIGITVREAPPSPDDATEQPTQNDIDTTDEEALAVLSSAQADSNPTRDPMRTYLREMGGKTLLTREGEIELAKRKQRYPMRCLF